MATSRRPTPDSDPRRPARLLVPAEQLGSQLDERITRGIDLVASLGGDQTALQDRRQDYYSWHEYNETLLRHGFDQPGPAKDYAYVGARIIGFNETLRDKWNDLATDIRDHNRRLQSLRDRLPLFELSEEAIQSTSSGERSSVQGEDVFIVHGHDGHIKTTVARFLAQLTKREPVILHERPDGGRTVIEKFEAHADQAAAAVVLLTGDDLGGTRAGGGEDGTGLGPQQLRARQNVVLELGFFIGKLGRANVVILYEQGVELPSDLAGVLYVELDAAGGWKTRLARELKSSGVDVDLAALLLA